MYSDKANPGYRRDLGDGLILRWSTIDDAEEIVYLTSMVFRNGPNDPPNMATAMLMQETMTGRYPPMGAGDVAVVEDTRRREHRLVCCTCLWRMTWDYEGIPFEVGRPEIVATDIDYRNRGLVRAVFELIHARSEAEGHMAQAITGIPYFYRQFDYEFAVDLDAQHMTHFAFISDAPEGMAEPFVLRDATMADIPFIQEVYNQSRARYPVSSVMPYEWWSYQIEMMHRIPVEGFWLIKVIIDQEGVQRGYVILPAQRWRHSIPVFALDIAVGVNMQVVMPPVLRAIRSLAADMPAPTDALPADRISFRLPTTHPAYDVLGKLLAIGLQIPYAWYVRVPDLPRFLKHIAPVLERRLAGSPVAGYSGTLSLNFYRVGLQLEFANGRLVAVEPWRAPQWGEVDDAAFPPLVFLQLLFGRRGLDDLRYAFPDVWAKNEIELVIKTLFPAKPSWVLPMG